MVVLLLAGLGLAAPAMAQDVPECEGNISVEERIQRGVELRRQNRPRDALHEFRCAHAQTPTPPLLLQIAAAEQAAGLWVEAEEHYLQVIGARDPSIEDQRPHITTWLVEVGQHLGDMEVLGPAGAEVWIGGRRVARLPLAQPLRLPIGPVLFEVRSAGHYTATRQASIQAGRVSRESVALVPLPPVKRRSFWIRHRVSLGLSGVAVALAVAGVGTGISTWRGNVDLRNSCALGPTGCPMDDIASLQHKALATNVLFGLAGGMAIVAGGVFLFGERAASVHEQQRPR